MSMNIFQIGNVVTGDSFIGRKEKVSKVKEYAFSHPIKRSISLVGLTRIGKTSIIQNAITESEAHSRRFLYSHIILSEHSGVMEFWKTFIADLYDPIQIDSAERDRTLFQLFDSIESIKSEIAYYPILIRQIKKLMRKLATLDYQSLLVIDEFDYAQTLFQGKKPYFEFLRTITSTPEYNINTILISRRELHIIEACAPGESTFHGVFKRKSIKGFNQEDMTDYYDKLMTVGIELNPSQKNELIYYCGNLPYLLSIFGCHLVEAKLDTDIIPNIKDVYSQNSPQILRYYSDIVRQLRHDNLIDQLLRIISNSQTRDDKLYIDSFYAMGLLTQTNGEVFTVSPHFTEYLLSGGGSTMKSFPDSKRRFRVALSFPGEQRPLVKEIADALSQTLTKDRVLYDGYHRAEFARPNLDVHLQTLYGEQSDLIVVFICSKYNEKEWTGIEWRAIRALMNHKENSSRIMFVKCDKGSVDGVFGTIDGYIDAQAVSIMDITSDILLRLGI